MNSEELKMKKDEINKITNELRSHYLIDEFFVDPDKKFTNLLSKIIKFFEEDDFVIHIKQNEHLYETFKGKYESAVDLIQTIESEKEKLQHSLKKMTHNHNYMCANKRESYYEGEESPLSKADLSCMSLDSPNIKKGERINSEFSIHLPRSVNKFHLENENESNSLTQMKHELEKLKEDYFNVYEEKKFLEHQLNESLKYKELFLIQKESLNNLQIQFESANADAQKYSIERNALQERTTKLSKENYDLTQSVSKLKENFNMSEKERNATRSKISIASNMVKTLEKEIASLRKKNQASNAQIKDLKEKLKDETDDRILQEKKYEDTIAEMENKIEILQLEKTKILKDSMTHLMNTLNEDQAIDFVYNSESNKIEIFFDRAKVAEVDNKTLQENEAHETGTCIDNETVYLKTDNTNEPSSPLRRKFNNEIFYEEGRAVTEGNMQNFPHKQISLNKLFSKSKSSKKSVYDKENIQMFSNTKTDLNIINKSILESQSPSKKIRISNLSNSNGKMNERGSNTITNFSSLKINPFDPFKMDNCIKKTNLNNNLRYVLSSNNNTIKHKKYFSLDEALGEDVWEEKENVNLVKKLDFLSVSSQNNFTQDGKKKNMKFDISTFNLNFPILKVENSITEENEIESIKAEEKEKEIVIKKEDIFYFIEHPRESFLLDNKETAHYETALLGLNKTTSNVQIANKLEKDKSHCLKYWIFYKQAKYVNSKYLRFIYFKDYFLNIDNI